MTRNSGKRIGFIGAGNMGRAIISRLSDNGKGKQVTVFDIDRNRAASLSEEYGVAVAGSAGEVAKGSDICIIATKPADVTAVCGEIRSILRDETVLVSVAAGISIAEMEKSLSPSKKIVRVMPNTPALVGEGMSVICANKKVDTDELTDVTDIFSIIGKFLVLPEKYMDAVTGLSGSGPAYVFTVIQAMADGGVKMGLPRDKAQYLAAQTVLGAAKLVIESGEDPIALRGKVTSPGGTTIEGVHVLERNGFSGILMDAVEEAALKSAVLGEKK